MSDIPDGWDRACLGDIVRPRSQRVSPRERPDAPYIGLENVEPQSNRILGTVPASVMSSDSAVFEAGDVLYGRMRPYLNKVVRPPFAGLASAEFIIIPESPAIDAGFLIKRLSSTDFVDYACSQYEGDRPRVKFEALAQFNIKLPPLREQTRIVAKLEELLSDLDAGVAELKAAQKKLTQYRQSLLKAAVEGALTAEWRAQHSSTESGAQLLERILTERRARWEARQLAKFREQGKTPPKDWQAKYPEPVRPPVITVPSLPQGWVFASLSQLSEFITSGSRGWSEYYSIAGAGFIRSQNINRDYLDLSDLAFVDLPANSEGMRTKIEKRDVLVTITGANVGKTACIETDIQEAYVSQHIALIRLIDKAIAKYLWLFLITNAGGRGQLDREAYGAGKPGLNLEQVAKLCIPLPGITEIHEIVRVVAEHIEAVVTNEKAISQSRTQAAAQRQNILRAAFAGQLVPQDPNDEPASALLARIRAERAVQGEAQKPRAKKARAPSDA